MANTWGRLMTAVRAGVQAFREADLYPVEQHKWDSTTARFFRYIHAANYYNNTIYRSLVTYAARHKQSAKLYEYTRGIYNPVARLVDAYPDKVYGGALDMESLKGGAIPLVGVDDERLAEAIRLIWKWSNWQSAKSMYVRHGALLGDSPIKVATNLESGKVWLELLHPSKIQEAEFDAVGNVKAVYIAYDDIDPNTGKQIAYEEFIDEWGFEIRNNGRTVDEWDNPYGFVPVVVARHKETGFAWGANAFQSELYKIDELNDAASNLNDQIRKSVKAVWGVFGAAGAVDVKQTGTDKGQVPMLYFPSGTSAQAMVAQLDLTAALENIKEMITEIEKDMPELTLYQIRGQSQMTAPGVRAGWSDAIGKIVEARGQYDGALVRAHQMAVSIGAYHRLPGFEAFSLNSYREGSLEHYIAERPVIDDSLTAKERIETLQALKDVPPAVARLILTELNFSAEDIENVIIDLEAAQERETRNAIRGFAEGVFGTATPGSDGAEEIEGADHGETESAA